MYLAYCKAVLPFFVLIPVKCHINASCLLSVSCSGCEREGCFRPTKQCSVADVSSADRRAKQKELFRNPNFETSSTRSCASHKTTPANGLARTGAIPTQAEPLHLPLNLDRYHHSPINPSSLWTVATLHSHIQLSSTPARRREINQDGQAGRP